jgi:ABC-type nitrate/sulfonate/bicarbonate transport system permease component
MARAPLKNLHRVRNKLTEIEAICNRANDAGFGPFLPMIRPLWQTWRCTECGSNVGSARRAQIVFNPETYHHFKVTLYEFFVAMLIALTWGLGFGFLFGGKKSWGDVFEPIILPAYPVPIIIIYPLCILFFEIGSNSKITFAGVYGFFPIVINTLTGVRNVNPNFVAL